MWLQVIGFWCTAGRDSKQVFYIRDHHSKQQAQSKSKQLQLKILAALNMQQKHEQWKQERRELLLNNNVTDRLNFVIIVFKMRLELYLHINKNIKK